MSCKYIFSTNSYLMKGSTLIYRHVILLILEQVSLWTNSSWLRYSRYINIYHPPGDCGFYFQMCKCWYIYIYIYIYINFKPKTTCAVVNISKYKNTSIFHKYFRCFQNLLLYICVYNTSVTVSNANFLLMKIFCFSLILAWDRNLWRIMLISSKMLKFGSSRHWNK